MNENLGDFILSTHVADAIIDPLGETLDTSAKSENPYVQAVLSMVSTLSSGKTKTPNSQVSA